MGRSDSLESFFFVEIENLPCWKHVTGREKIERDLRVVKPHHNIISLSDRNKVSTNF